MSNHGYSTKETSQPQFFECQHQWVLMDVWEGAEFYRCQKCENWGTSEWWPDYPIMETIPVDS